MERPKLEKDSIKFDAEKESMTKLGAGSSNIII